MKQESRIKSWKDMFANLNDPDRQEQAKRKKEREQRAEMKKADTGL